MRTLLALVLLALGQPLNAQPDPNEDKDQVPPFSYLFLSGALTRDRDKSLDVTREGFSLGGSVDLSANTFFSAGYSHGETGRVTLQTGLGTTEGEVVDDGFSLGIGGHRTLTRRTDLTSSLSYVQSRTQLRQVGGPKSEDRSEGASASLGLRHLFHPWVEGSVGSSYSFVSGERGWDMSGGLGFLMTRTVWMDIDYYNSGSQESDGWSLGLRTVLGD